MIKKQIIKKITISSALLFSLFLLCLIPNNKNSIDLKQKIEYIDNKLHTEKVYLLDKNNYLAEANVVIDNKNIEFKAKEMLNTLIKDSSSENKIPSGFKSVIPSNTEILSLEYKDNLVKVNFNSGLLDVKKEDEEKIIEAIIYTLTSIKDIKQVIIYVDGNILSKLPKSKINLPSTLDRSYGINKEYEIDSYKDITKVTMYYLNEYNDNYYYVPVTKYLNSNKDKLEIIIDELANSNTNLISFVNSNTKLLDKKVEDKKVILTFNEYIFDNDEILEEVKQAINLSVKDNYDIEEVILKYNDKEICNIK